MFSITITNNIADVAGKLTKKLTAIQGQDLAVLQASTLLAVMRDRIHVQGINSNGSQIGSYSDSYLKRREKNKRGGDPKVIISYTRQLEKNYTIIPASDNSAGIGFANKENYDKAKWMEQRYGAIWMPTKGEQELIKGIANDYIKEVLK